LPARPVKFQGSGLARAALRLAGWRVVFDGLPARQGVLIVYPHTSNWDFPLGVLTKWTLGIPVSFWGKDSLFKVPVFGAWVRWLGGIPVDRFSARGVVGDMAARFRAARQADEFLWLALAPEGTRKYQDHWRSGFYAMTVQAEVPLGLVAFDYATREVRVNSFLKLSGDSAADMAVIAGHFSQVRGLRHEQAAPIRIRQG
jgi:1-acyl-sn-glycerol-3-phosphate acyltransferase